MTAQSTSVEGVTNAVTTTCQQMTGLSDALRSRSVVTAANGTVYTEVSVFDPESRELTVTRRTDNATPSIGVSMFGRPISSRALNEVVHNWFDPFGRVYYYVVSHPVTDDYLYDRWMEFDDSGNEVYHDAYYGDLFITGSKTFDAFSRETVRTDALGNAVTTAYDALGRPVAADGATYPTLTTYDTAGRMTSLSTTRDDSTWDTTQWFYDRAMGLATNKVYADGKGPGYAYTVDGKPLRTTWARGAWRENGYTVEELLSSVEYSDTTPAVSLTYDAIQRLAAASNAVAQFAYLNSALGTATNETSVVGTNAFTLTRQLDSLHRLAALSMDGQLHATYSYDAENRLHVVSNDAFSVNYAYTGDGWDAGHIVAMTNGTVLSHTVSHDPYRRHLVTGVSNAVAGTVASDLHYGYDILGRVVSRNSDAFGYNARSEVASAIIQPSSTNHFEYDGIGNNVWTSLNGATNAYTANAINQYTNILRASAPPREDAPFVRLGRQFAGQRRLVLRLGRREPFGGCLLHLNPRCL